MPCHPPARRRRGSSLSLTIVLSVIMTALIAALALTAGSESQSVAGLAKQDQAFYTAESGMQVVLWYMRNNQLSSLNPASDGSGTTSKTLSMGTYNTSWPAPSAGVYQLTSLGSAASGNASYTLKAQATTPVGNVPLFATKGSLDMKNVVIDKDVAVGGSYSNGGSGSLGGLLYLGKGGSAPGVPTSQIVPDQAFQPLDTSLLSGGKTVSSGTTFDFTAVNGTKKEIHYVGNLKDPTFIGSGVLYVEGTITFSNNATTQIGDLSTPVYLVATGDISFNQFTTVYGGIYTQGNFNRAKIYVYGYVYVEDTINTTSFGQAHFYAPQTSWGTPWFDTRAGTGNGTGSVTLANVTGPQP